jgi:hypothetical protein
MRSTNWSTLRPNEILSGSIQPDYGAFDPKFPGVTLRFYGHNTAAWPLFARVSAESTDAAEVVRIGREAMGDPHRLFEVISVCTALPHEVRHFHDFLLSPLGNRLFRNRVLSTFYALQLLKDVLRGGRPVPVPLTRWEASGDAVRERCITAWTMMYGPVAQECHGMRFSGDGAEALKRIRGLFEGSKDLVTSSETARAGLNFQPEHVFEASAVLAQAQQVFLLFGSEQASFFLTLLQNSVNVYSVVFRLLSDLWDEWGVPLDVRTMSAVTTWSILGEHAIEERNACPTRRFMKLFALLSHEGPPASGVDVRALMDEWSAQLGASSVEESLAACMQANERFLTKFDAAVGAMGGTYESQLSWLRGAMHGLAEAHAHMAAGFLADPDRYVDPYRWDTEPQWVQPAIAVEFVGGGLDVNLRDEPQIIVHRGRAHARDPEQVLVERCLLVPQDGRKYCIPPELAANVGDLIAVADLFFSPFQRDSPDYDLVRSIFGEDRLILEMLMRG